MALSLEKRSSIAEVSLVKSLTKAKASGHELGEVSAQVILVFDYSGSMAPYFARGEVQELAERALGLALPLDDDGNIQVFPFHHEAFEPFVVDAGNYAGAVDDWRYRRGRFAPSAAKSKGLFRRAVAATPSGERLMGGTDYSVVIDAVLRYITDNKMAEPGQPPVFVLFQTDGGTSNVAKVEQQLRQAASLPVFWQFLGLGHSTGFLDILDRLPNRVVDNVGKYGVPSVKNTDDEEFYDGVTGEFVTQWIPAARAAGVLKDQS